MENIRNENFLGSDKVIVGNKYADLVLETLGKVYIKTGNNSKVLSDVLALLDRTTESEIKSQTIIVNSLLELEEMEYPGDGFFIYNTLTTTLYIAYAERYIALIEAAEGASDGYVRRKGDTMSGSLEISTIGAPLIIASSKLVRNLNVEYIDGYASKDLAKKKVDEYIYGAWTFKGEGTSENNWTFKENIRLYGDMVTSRSVSTPEFASGFGGYGWRIDSDTNTLTIDYLVVRKAMRVFEMVINKISATNGSIWVSNSSKCSKAIQPTILTTTHLSSVGGWTGSEENKNRMLSLLNTNTFYLITDDAGNYIKNIDNYREDGTGGVVTMSSELSKPSSVNTVSKTFVNYNFLVYIKNPLKLINSPLFEGPQSLYDEAVLASEWSTYTGPASEEDYRAYKSCITLYYINKEKTVIEWDDVTPKVWKYLPTFNKDHTFYMIPNNSTAISTFENSIDGNSAVVGIKAYYKYFATDTTIMQSAINKANIEFNTETRTSVTVPNMWIVSTDDEEYPMFKPGDILRCQKYSNGNIKYYDAIVLSQIESRQFIIQKAASVFDIYSEINYDANGNIESIKEEYNNTQYAKTEEHFSSKSGSVVQSGSNYNTETNSYEPKTPEDRLDDIAEGDDMIQVGNIQNVDRQNAIYLTSTDDNGPYIDVIAGLNRPDYSVLYNIPVYDKKVVIHESTRQEFFIQDILSKDTTEIYVNEVMYYGTLYPTQFSKIKRRDNKWRWAYTKTTKVRVGNLSGIYNETFGNKQPYGFGLYGENVFLTGEFYLSNGQSVVNFSEEQLLLKFKMAGLVIRDTTPNVLVPVIGLDDKPVLDESGNQVYRNQTEIVMTADHIKFNTVNNKTAMTLITEDPITKEAMLDVQGNIQSHGLKIFGNKQNGMGYGVTAELTSNGNLIAWDAVLNNVTANGIYCRDIIAVSGKIAGFKIDNTVLSWIGAMGWNPDALYYYGIQLGTTSYRTNLPASTGMSSISTYIKANGEYSTAQCLISVFAPMGTGIFSTRYPEGSSSIQYPFTTEFSGFAGWFDGNLFCTDVIASSRYAIKDGKGWILGKDCVLNGIETDNENQSGLPGSLNINGHVDIVVRGGLIVSYSRYK